MQNGTPMDTRYYVIGWGIVLLVMIVVSAVSYHRGYNQGADDSLQKLCDAGYGYIFVEDPC